jgi:diphthamide synthase (EF-2-diphthine--ammonia ligase)
VKWEGGGGESSFEKDKFDSLCTKFSLKVKKFLFQTAEEHLMRQPERQVLIQIGQISKS